jgi:hypothetical protein
MKKLLTIAVIMFAIVCSSFAQNKDKEFTDCVLNNAILCVKDTIAKEDDPTSLVNLYHMERPMLEWALINRNTDMAKLLLENGANIDAPNEFGQTPLQKSILMRTDDMTKFLLDNDADVNIQDNLNGWTALMYTTCVWSENDDEEEISGFIKGANALLKYAWKEIDFNLKDKEGRTARKCALEKTVCRGKRAEWATTKDGKSELKACAANSDCPLVEQADKDRCDKLKGYKKLADSIDYYIAKQKKAK